MTPLAERDLKVNDIETQIKKRQKLILDKARDLEQTKKENQFLEYIYKDYRKYYSFILNEKKQQIQTLGLLQNYLDNLMRTDKITKVEVANVKNDQTIILEEISKIKSELDNLIS